MKKQEKHFFHITCAPGLESALESELKELGLRRLRVGRGAVRFQGSFRAALRVVLWSRVASRVLMELVRVGAGDGDELYDEVLHLPWEDRLSAKSTFAIDVIGTSRSLRHTHYTSQRIKDGICDRLRELWGVRPSIDPHNPTVQLVGRLYRDECTLSFDLAGERLHRRGYRAEQVEAPLKENLASGILYLAGWDGASPLLDPMCGGGTLVIEGAMRATQIAPGETLEPACTSWPWRGDEWRELWDELRSEAREGALEESPAWIQGGEIDPLTLAKAQRNAKAAGVRTEIDWVERDARNLDLPQGPGWIVCNPPYGERLEDVERAEQLMAEFCANWKETKGFTLAVIGPWESMENWTGCPASRKIPLRNGKIDAFLHVFSPAQPA